MLPKTRLGDLRKWLDEIDTDPQAQKFMRHFIQEIVADCPVNMLADLGEVVEGYWSRSVRGKAEEN